jgi:hypothetical protein
MPAFKRVEKTINPREEDETNLKRGSLMDIALRQGELWLTFCRTLCPW